jgi:hypothetical protein
VVVVVAVKPQEPHEGEEEAAKPQESHEAAAAAVKPQGTREEEAVKPQGTREGRGFPEEEEARPALGGVQA